jgi:hypothetical protein
MPGAMSEKIRAIHATVTSGGFLLASMVGTQGHSHSCLAEGETVSSSRAGFVDRRDAAMASVLAGGVVVILGYASGIGITPTDAATAATPAAQPPASTAPATPMTTPPPATTIAQPSMPAMPGTSTMPDMSMPADPPHTATTHPTTKPTEPAPADPAGTCPPSVLNSVPAVGPLTSSLLSSVLSSTPLVSDLAGPPVKGKAPGPLTCLVGTVVGPTCCAATTTAAKDSE